MVEEVHGNTVSGHEVVTSSDILTSRATAFIHQKYPLSPLGRELRTRVGNALAANDMDQLKLIQSHLPTVENPEMKLFEDLKLTDEQAESILGYKKLAFIQTTKGCSHNCLFCAAGSEHRVSIMPSPAILKIGEVIKRFDGQPNIRGLWKSWEETILKETGIDLRSGNTMEAVRREQEYFLCNADGEFGAIQNLLQIYRGHPISGYFDDEWFMEKYRKDIRQVDHTDFRRTFFSRKGLFPLYVTNYFDSDPFDYRDSASPHQDGTPADYSDVVKALATDLRLIHITTAGWRKSDRVAQRAGEKIVILAQQHPELFGGIRISVNKTEGMAQQDLGEYLSQIENVIKTLQDADPEVLLIYDERAPNINAFRKKVVIPLKQFIHEINLEGNNHPAIKTTTYTPSYYSGRMADKKREATDRDIMSIMPGMHIWPDGTIAFQTGKRGASPFEDKGHRPKPIGLNIFPGNP